MRKTAILFCSVVFSLASVGVASADPSAPTNGGSANGAGQSGNCTGANADRPAACHNGHGSGN